MPHNHVDFIGNDHFTYDIFHDITIFYLRDVAYSMNTMQKLLKLPYHSPKNR